MSIDQHEERLNAIKKSLTRYFSFLEEELGFHSCVFEESMPILSFYFLSDQVRVHGNYAFYSGEFEVYATPLRNEKLSVPLYSLAAYSTERIESAMLRVGEAIRANSIPILMGDIDAYKSELKSQNEIRAKQAEQTRQQQVKDKMQQSWKNKEYSLYVKLAAEIRDSLSPAEMAKLAYIQKHVPGQ